MAEDRGFISLKFVIPHIFSASSTKQVGLPNFLMVSQRIFLFKTIRHSLRAYRLFHDFLCNPLIVFCPIVRSNMEGIGLDANSVELIPFQFAFGSEAFLSLRRILRSIVCSIIFSLRLTVRSLVKEHNTRQWELIPP